ncbi:uncharacterized protein LOC106013275 [Aplysia californica]|uniref:Uncharacterized protein LOC106013275 n=1 Tax=Aplysia californica TaxID=6500 RepID=A0ABM1AAH8_APLCA|nr:uncharacterized protein LOC106013275 [Aplysia californica]
MRRQSLASPELTAMLERQRTHSVERQRAASADSRRPTLKVDRRAAPRFNLLKDHQQTLLDKKRGVCEEKEDQVQKVSADLPQCFLQRVHRCVQAGSSSCVIASLLKSHVSSRLHTDRAKRVLDAVKDKTDFFCLLQLCNYDKEALTCALWYGVLMS